MADTPPQPATEQPLHSTDSDGKRTMSVNGKVYAVLDVGYLYGSPYTSCIILSEETIVVSPIPAGPPICGICLHPEGPNMIPDWVLCSQPVGGHGSLIKFKAPWECHCLKLLNYQSIDMTTVDPTVVFVSMCGVPKVPPPTANLAIAAAAVSALLIAGGLTASASFFQSVNQLAGYNGDVPPGFDPSINITEASGTNPPATECPEDTAGLVVRPSTNQPNSDCK